MEASVDARDQGIADAQKILREKTDVSDQLTYQKEMLSSLQHGFTAVSIKVGQRLQNLFRLIMSNM